MESTCQKSGDREYVTRSRNHNSSLLHIEPQSESHHSTHDNTGSIEHVHPAEKTMRNFDATSDEGANNANYEASNMPIRLHPIVATAPPCFIRGLRNIRSSWKEILIAQLLSLFLAASGATNSALSVNCNLSAPTMQIGLVYFLLSFNLFFIPQNSIEYESTPYFENGDDDGSAGCDSGRNNSATRATENEADNEIIIMRNSPTTFLFNRIPVQGSLRMYTLMAFFDVEANYLTYLAFRYTTLVSVSLLDALAIPSSMFFSFCILKRFYRLPHFIGASICMIGIALNIMGDYYDRNSKGIQSNNRALEENVTDDGVVPDDSYPYVVRGDILATVGALLYGLNDVLTERIVKDNNGTKEYLGVIGLFGFIICVVQCIITERESILDFFHQTNDTCDAVEGWFLLGLCAILGAISYTGMSMFLQKSEAALLNLSLLTGDLWAVLFSVSAEHVLPSPHFWMSLVLIIFGVFAYEISH